MADLFDIANLITTVGVDAVKIKPEPGLPEKSSNEILTELFSTFDVDESVASLDDDNDSQEQKDAIAEDGKKEKVSEKKKKSKKKHKHKDKKHKKKSKHNSSDSSDAESNGVRKKKKHKKKIKRKHDAESNKSLDVDETKAKKAKPESLASTNSVQNNFEHDKCKTDVLSPGKRKSPHESSQDRKTSRCSNSPLLPPIPKKTDDDVEDSVIPKIIEKSKSSQGKIQIKDLKNSVVYNEVVKEVENKEKQKAARMEDGEISDSNNDSGTPTLSPTPPPRKNSYRTPSLSPTPSSIKMSSRNDLRLILREKEKKRWEIGGRSRSRDGKEYRESRVHRSHGHADINNRESKRSHSCHSRDRKRSESQNRTNSHRSRSGDRERWRDGSSERRGKSHERRESARSRERRRHRSRSIDRYSHSARSRSRQRKERIEIDKKKLLEIARKNAINMIKQGTLPLAQQDKAIAAIQAGGKTVDELTDFCKSLSKSEALGELSSISSEEDGSGSEKGFHHPFLLKERPSSIIMNIKDAKQLPTKTFQEKTAESSNQLRLQFPVSSGQLHRKTESEWVPVSPKKPVQKKAFVPAQNVPVKPVAIMPPSVPVAAPVPVIPQAAVFPPAPPEEPVDIGAIVSQRLAAMRKLRENPHDVCALNEMYRAQNEMKTWAESKQMPGQFTGSTGVKVLTPAELTSGYQAWARKDQLVSAQPVSGGMGMALLQKMGWRPGEGLGKNKEGTLEPLQLEVKLDKKGLVSEADVGQKINKQAKASVPTVKTLEGKHPVSLLGEYCSKRKLGAPVYELCFESGPDHKKNFLFKVKVNGIEYKPTVASPNKKQAKYEAAQVCLQTLGLLPS